MKTNLSTTIMTARLAAGRWFITAMLLSAAGSLVAQTDKQVWVQRFGTTGGPSRDIAYSIATDSAGNVIVAGDSNEQASYGTGIVVIKYSGSGEALWTNRYESGSYANDHAGAVAVDDSDNVFVSSWYSGGYLTLAFSSSGMPLWTNLFPTGNASAPAMAVDHSGNVFITGRQWAFGAPSLDYVTLKYSGSGIALWTNRFDGPGGGHDVPVTLAVDNAGSVVVTGQSRASASANEADIITIKYAADGVPVWTNRYGAPGISEDVPKSVAMDGSGNVLVNGQSRGTNGYVLLTIKYSENGVALWTNRFPGTAWSMAADTDGNVVVVGFSTDEPEDFFITAIKYSASGETVWTNQNSVGYEYLADAAVVIDDGGNIFVTAYPSPYDSSTQFTLKYSSSGSLLWTNRFHVPPLSDDEDYDGVPVVHPKLVIDLAGNALVLADSYSNFVTLKYASDGTASWTNVYDGIVHSADYPSAVAVDSSGNIIVTGGGNDFATIKYSPAGIPLWTNYYDGPTHFGDKATAVAVASNGNVFVTGYSYPGDWEDVSPRYVTIAYTGQGVPLWTNRANSGAPVAIAVDGSGDVLVTGNYDVVLGDGIWVTIKYSEAGVPLWTNRHARYTSWAGDLAVDSHDDFVVVGRSAQQSFAAIKFSNAGLPLWTNLYTSSPSNAYGPNGFATAVAVWTNGDIFVTGYTDDAKPRSIEDGSHNNFVTIRYSTAGVPVWTNLYGAEGIGDYAYALALDFGGDVVVTGVSQNNPSNYAQNIVTIKYSNGGNALWTNLYAGSMSRPNLPYAVAVDANGNVFVTGASGSYPNTDSITLAYSSSGIPLWTNRYHGPVGNSDEAYDIAVTGVGEVVIVGNSSGDYATVKYSTAGLPPPLPAFENVTATVAPGLPGMAESSVTWADFDNDGRLDFFVTGSFTVLSEDGEPNEYYASQLWRNTKSGFASVMATVAPGLPGVYASSAAWGDYDNDGRLDLLLTGIVDRWDDDGISQIWRNTGSGFSNVTATVAPGLLGVGYGSVAWGDYDNDGRLDFVITGFTIQDDRQGISQVWRNTGSGFTNVTATVAPGLPGLYDSSVAWGDYDNDGRLDFLLTGAGQQFVCQLWRNTGSGFVDVTDAVAPGLPQLNNSSVAVAWADYDNDGKLDFMLTGFEGSWSAPISQLWRNTGSGFTNVTASVAPGLQGTYFNSVTWGDYDNDGRLDLFLTGNSPQLWRNTGAGFTNVTATVAPGLLGVDTPAWGDYDNDGRLDLFLAGYPQQILRNQTPVTNTPPSAPTGLAMTASSNAVMLSWNSATDDHTPASGLTYNVRAGTTPGGNNLLSAHVNATNGFRRVPAMGNAMLRHSLPLTGLTNGQTVYWSVQAVDSAFAGGPFATETSVVSLPQLRISRPNATNAVVSWTPPTFGWLLQQSTNLNTSNWIPTPSANANPTTLPATNGARFYRLHQP